ncbi:MAG: hypothetical protein JSU00_25675 [Acidobacteria bacterium]|nr:hypothetical protein [Acidobacteriota bacterium]
MADNKLELVVEVDVNKANASIKTVNSGLSSIEQTAAKAAHGASSSIDGMTAAMVKGATAGNLLAEGIKKAIEWAKEWTIEAAKLAAHEARMEASTRALAKAHGVSAEAMERSVEAVRKVGFHGEDALHTIDRMIIADLDLSKAQGLAKIAKDAAAIENISAPEALEKILQAIEFGNARALRAAGLRVDLEKEVQVAELTLGRTLSENEKVQLRYNAVVREAAKIQGAAAAASGEAESQMKALSREVDELKEAVGARFQEQFKAIVHGFRELVGWLKDNTDLLVKFGETALWVAGILATYGLATKIMELAKAIAALNLASLNPYALLAGGVVAAGAIVYSEWKNTQEQLKARYDEMERQALRDDLFKGKVKVDDLRKKGMTDDQIRELISGKKLLPGETFEFGGPKITVKTTNEPDLETLKRAQEIRKRQAQAERDSLEAALAAEAHGVTGPAKILLEMRKEISKYTTFVDDRGATHPMRLTAKTRENLERELRAKVRQMQKEEMADYLKEQQEAYQQRLAWESDLYQKRLTNNEDIARRNLDHLADVYRFEEQRAGYGRDAQLRAVEALDAQTLRQKLWVEQRKMEIEVAYLQRVNDIKLRLFDLDTSRMLIEEEANLKRLGYKADEIRARIAEVTQQRQDLRGQQQESTDAAIQAARENAAVRQGQLIRDENRRIFDSFKRQAEGVFDALLTKSQSIWSAIGNSLKTALLTAIKDVVSSRVAAMLMQLFTGQKVSFQPGGMGGGGMLGKLGGILGVGAVPVFAGGAPGGTPPFVPSGGGVPSIIPSVFGAPTGATPPFVPSAGGAAGTGGIFSKAGWAGFLPGLKSFLGIGGSVQLAPGVATTWEAATLGQKLSSIGKSNAALMAGAMLAFDGLRRGGFTGMAETTAGGAMIGYKFGGPLGAAIGAAAGLVAGIVRLFVKGAEEKAKAKIKALYGVDIADKGVLKQIVDTAKSAFGGNLDLAIRSPQVRDLIQLYAMTTGQKPTGMPGTVTPLSLVETAGSLFQSPSYNNGSPLPGLSGLPSLDKIGGGTPSAAGPTVINITVPGAKEFFEKETVRVVVENPRAVQSAAMTATKANAGRREMTGLQLSPGLIVS